LDTRKVLQVACHEDKVILKRDRSNHWVSTSDGLTGALKVTINATGKLRSVLVKWENLFGQKRRYEGLNTIGPLHLLKAFDDLHHCDGRYGVSAKAFAIGARMLSNALVSALKNLRKNIRIEKRLIHHQAGGMGGVPGQRMRRELRHQQAQAHLP
jgi:hypothetical protein